MVLVLPGTVHAQKANDLALTNRKRQSVHRAPRRTPKAAVLNHQFVNLYGPHHSQLSAWNRLEIGRKSRTRSEPSDPCEDNDICGAQSHVC